jgi:ABC-type transport system substrate-binding protein
LSLPDWPTRVAATTKGQYDFCVIGTSGVYNDPDYLSSFLGGTNWQTNSFGFADPELDTLLKQGASTLGQDKRKPIYQRIISRGLELAPVVGLSWRSQAYAHRTNVKGFRNLPGFLTFFSVYSLDGTSLEK